MQRVFGFLVVLASLAVGWYWMTYQEFLKTPLKIEGDHMVLEVPKGANLRTLGSRLERDGVINQGDYLYWHARWLKKAHLIRAGEYAIPMGTTPDGLLNILVAGKTISYSLTLLEGWNYRQVFAAVANAKTLQQELTGLSLEQVMEKLGMQGEHPEGKFFPETYAFPKGTTDVEFLKRAHRKMQQELAEAWEDRSKDTLLKTPEEALILASIVEKETGVPHERPAISGVFTRRLKINMKLQTDPTVIYGMGERYKGNIRRKDLREDTPYNTYVHKGLPPTPICMPGRAALDAALNPEDGKSLYFVAKGDGSHVFSATLKQHNAAVRKYQLKK